ncbi:MAG: hypothetical protein ACRDF4_05715 [Rhabdochlamydiaceae bacterium]
MASKLRRLISHQSALMIVTTRDRGTLDKALEESGLKSRSGIKEIGNTRSGHQKFQLTLAPVSPYKFVRLSTSGRKMRNVSCAHGYECFAERFFESDPDASIHSGAARKKGIGKVTKGNLDWAREDIKGMNIGSQMIPLEYSKACNCEADLPAADYRMQLKEISQDYSGAIKRAQGAILRSDEAKRLR